MSELAELTTGQVDVETGEEKHSEEQEEPKDVDEGPAEVVTGEEKHSEEAEEPKDIDEVPAEEVAEDDVKDVEKDATTEGPAEEETEVEGRPSRAEISETIAALLVDKDLQTVSMNQLKAEIEQELGLDNGALDDRRQELRDLVTAELQRINDPETPQKEKTKKGKKRKHRAAGLSELLSLAQEKARRIVEKRASTTEQGESESSEKTSKAEFLKGSPLSLELGGETLQLNAKSFASGTCGYSTCAKVKVSIDGVERELQCQVNCAVLGSESWSA